MQSEKKLYIQYVASNFTCQFLSNSRNQPCVQHFPYVNFSRSNMQSKLAIAPFSLLFEHVNQAYFFASKLIMLSYLYTKFANHDMTMSAQVVLHTNYTLPTYLFNIKPNHMMLISSLLETWRKEALSINTCTCTRRHETRHIRWTFIGLIRSARVRWSFWFVFGGGSGQCLGLSFDQVSLS